jgi:hypothetical protein
MATTKTTNSVLLIVLKEMLFSFKVLFQSNNNREFRRLKDFISS